MGKETQRKQIHITNLDLQRLEKLIGEARMKNSRDGKHLAELQAELDNAVVMDSKEISLDVVTMNSKVVLVDLDSGKEVTLTLSFPAEANAEEGRVSVLAPVGTAIFGYRKGDVVEWEVPAGRRRLRVKELLYQPESAGDYDL